MLWWYKSVMSVIDFRYPNQGASSLIVSELRSVEMIPWLKILVYEYIGAYDLKSDLV